MILDRAGFLAGEAARAGARKISEVMGEVHNDTQSLELIPQTKTNGDITTIADLESERAIVQYIHTMTSDAVELSLGEETGLVGLDQPSASSGPGTRRKYS